MKKDEICGACNVHEGDKNVYKTLVGKPEGDHLKNLGTDGRIILKYISRK
jgi:hypothetical protein